MEKRKGSFTGWIYRSFNGMTSCSKKEFLTFGEARRYGGSDPTIVKISKVSEDNEKEIVIYSKAE